MGWWRQSKGLVWGDGPADAMDDALDAIKKQFLKEFGRLPSKVEIRAGLEFSMPDAFPDKPTPTRH